VVYALSFALPLLWPPSRRALLVAVSAWPFAVLAGGIAALIGSIHSPETLQEGRLVAPTGYPNASAALFFMAAFPAMALTARRELPPALRVALVPAAGVLAALALLTQSRGAVAAVVLTTVVAFAATPARLRLVVPVALVAVCVGVLSGELLDVRTTAQAGDGAGALDDAVAILIALAVALAAFGAAYVLVDRRVTPGAELVRRASVGARAALVTALAIGAVVFVVSEGSPFAWAQDQWNDFKTPDYTRVESGGNRFGGGLGSNRYDYWRASVDIARDIPLGGTGSENFASAYLERRRTLKAPAYAHSVWFTALGELGIPGLLLFGAFAVALTLALARAVLAAAGLDRAVTVAAVLPAVYLLVHGSGDFLQAFPALVVPALGLAAAVVASPAEARPTRGRAGFGVAAAAVVAALAVIPPFVSERLEARAASTWPERPDGALSDLRTAEDIDPLSATAPLQRGIVALQTGDRDEARDAFSESAKRDDKGWFARFELGLVLAKSGDSRAGRVLIEEARRLNPRQPQIAVALEELAEGRPPDPLIFARAVVQQGG